MLTLIFERKTMRTPIVSHRMVKLLHSHRGLRLSNAAALVSSFPRLPARAVGFCRRNAAIEIWNENIGRPLGYLDACDVMNSMGSNLGTSLPPLMNQASSTRTKASSEQTTRALGHRRRCIRKNRTPHPNRRCVELPPAGYDVPDFCTQWTQILTRSTATIVILILDKKTEKTHEPGEKTQARLRVARPTGKLGRSISRTVLRRRA